MDEIVDKVKSDIESFLMEDMENSNLSSLDISLPDGTKINIKKI